MTRRKEPNYNIRDYGVLERGRNASREWDQSEGFCRIRSSLPKLLVIRTRDGRRTRGNLQYSVREDARGANARLGGAIKRGSGKDHTRTLLGLKLNIL